MPNTLLINLVSWYHAVVGCFGSLIAIILGIPVISSVVLTHSPDRLPVLFIYLASVVYSITSLLGGVWLGQRRTASRSMLSFVGLILIGLAAWYHTVMPFLGVLIGSLGCLTMLAVHMPGAVRQLVK